MLKLFQYVKGAGLPLAAVVVLLFVQAFCDLTLPDYTKRIVDVGIQQGGVEYGAPEAVRRSELERLSQQLDPAQQSLVRGSYRLLDRAALPQEEYEQYVQQYPLLESEPIYVLMSKEDARRLSPVLSPVIAGEQGEGQSESAVRQLAAAWVRQEHAIVGIDTDAAQIRYILLAGSQMLGVALVSMAATVLVGFLASRIAAGLGRDLRGQVFRQVSRFSNTEMDQFSTASLITRSTNDIQQIQLLMVLLLRVVFYAPIMGVGGIIKVLGSERSLSWTIAVAVAAVLTLVSVLFAVAMPRFRRMQKLVDKLNLVTREILTGLPVIRAFSTEQHEQARFDAANRDLTRTNLFVNRLMVCMMPAMMLIMNLTGVLIVYNGGQGVAAGVIQVGDMMAFIQYTMQIIMAFLMISMVSVMLPRAQVSAQRIREVLETEPAIHDPRDPQPLREAKRGVVEFEDVSFRYPGAEEDVLSHISFTARAGETTALIGSTGSGKSTLLNLVPRFYDVSEGRVLVGGVDVRELPLQQLRGMLGYVPQKGTLFSGTIESNLKYGRAACTDAEMERAAQIAQAADFIAQSEEGYDTPIAQGGGNVSGGQKQRLSIARAIAVNPQIFLFDDSFSALDFKTDVALRRALAQNTAGATVLIVAQRISTVRHAEQIVVLDEGRIAGIGTHDALMRSCEVYRQIAQSQMSKEELERE